MTFRTVSVATCVRLRGRTVEPLVHGALVRLLPDASYDPVRIGGIGEGLRAREVRDLLDEWEAGAQARISLRKASPPSLPTNTPAIPPRTG
ncbi:hypothetical protein ACFRCW_23010 [Streptomyces sp. NPDC056653]|uniref:hypothetical protein n=1 Tax=Streptomyces sp. NPDC056653 TaxID=3345894 RepID=UPI0036B57A91